MMKSAAFLTTFRSSFAHPNDRKPSPHRLARFPVKVQALMSSKLLRSRILVVGRAMAVSFLLGIALCAQEPKPRLGKEIDNSLRVTVPGTHPPMAQTENDAGELPSGTMLHGIGIVLSRSAAQESDLETLIAVQQTVGSPQYHNWLSPDEFAARFGVADSDISSIRQWL